MPVPLWFDWIAGGASIAGLGYAWWASHQATGAKDAAQEAREAVYRRNTAEDIGRIRDLALDYLSALQADQFGLALHIAGRFLSACSRAREQHRRFLGVEGVKLELSIELIETSFHRMQLGVDRILLIADAQRVVRLVSSVKGVLDRESGGEQP